MSVQMSADPRKRAVGRVRQHRREPGDRQGRSRLRPRSPVVPIVSIVVPFFGLTNSILRILKGNPKKELQWRLQVCSGPEKIWVSVARKFVTRWPRCGVEGSSRVISLYLRVLGGFGAQGLWLRVCDDSRALRLGGLVLKGTGGNILNADPEFNGPSTLYLI